MVFHEIAKAGPCIKTRVKATLITTDGKRYIGTNDVANPQAKCPRAHMPHFSGYEACKSVCGQESHAEISAINLAGDDACGSTIYLEGHFAACPDCQSAANAAGVAHIIIGAPLSA